MPTVLGLQFRLLLDRRGLLMHPNAHERRYVLMLAEGPVVVCRHPTKVREAVMIAKAVYGDGRGEHAELTGLYARREELEGAIDLRDIAWVPHTADGPGLNPGKWVRLDAWLSDQFLLEGALAKMDEGVPI